MRHVERSWADDAATRAAVTTPRADLVRESPVDTPVDAQMGRSSDADSPAIARFVQVEGPFVAYDRTVSEHAGRLVERTSYRLDLPWFRWLFGPAVRHVIARVPVHRGSRTAWWAPPDLLEPHQVMVLGLLAAASMASAFVNTLFTQTVNFAADDFGVGDTGVGVGASIVRAGIVVTLPLAVLADRLGRRRLIVGMAYGAPLVSALGAIAPSFPLLVATQAVGRPLGLALDFLIAVAAAEEMPRNSRAYAVSVLALSAGLGAGLAVMALPLADLSPSSWRYVYLVALIWLPVAVSVARRLPETVRFRRPHVIAPRLNRSRFAVLAAIALLTNLLIAPASLFQNGYLEEVRGYSATAIAIFTLCTATPAGVGLMIGGRLADLHGRRRVIAVGLPIGAALLVGSFAVGGPAMWGAMIASGVVAGIAAPALGVYRTELFPTGNRGRAAGFLTAIALLGGVIGLLVTGRALDAGWSHASIMGVLALGQIGAVFVALRWLPETAHQTLETLNPIDQT